MNIDEFLDRELSDLGLQTDKNEYADTNAESYQPIKNFEPSELFEAIKADLGKGYLDKAEQSYIQLWHILAQQKLKWDKQLYEQMSIASRQFSIALTSAYSELKKKSDLIYELMNRARSALREGKKDNPFKLYSEIKAVYNSIPNAFFEEKKALNEQIMDFYKELRNSTDAGLVRRVSALFQEINMLLDKISLAIRANDSVSAIENYNNCIELYNQLPEGFLRFKNPIGIKLLEVYKSLSISAEITTLQKNLGNGRSSGTSASKASLELKKEPAASNKPSTSTLDVKKERAKKNIEMGFYNEASKDIQEVLHLNPKDIEAKAINAKIKTLQ